MNKDQVKGRVHDKDMKREGQAEKAHGKVQSRYGDAKEKIQR